MDYMYRLEGLGLLRHAVSLIILDSGWSKKCVGLTMMLIILIFLDSWHHLKGMFISLSIDQKLFFLCTFK